MPASHGSLTHADTLVKADATRLLGFFPAVAAVQEVAHEVQEVELGHVRCLHSMTSLSRSLSGMALPANRSTSTMPQGKDGLACVTM